ncbi:MAG: pseudouridine synthase [Verrucomicrobiales bacterium]
MEAIRINRYLAMCGLGSRRTCEQLVASGRVTVGDRVVDSLGYRVNPGDRVFVDGEPARPEKELVVLLHKPPGVVCTRSDPQGRRTIYDLLSPELQTLAHVGRLDRESEGMLVLTNAGDLAHHLTHPSTKVEKEYLVHVDRVFDGRDRARLLGGIELEEGMAYAAEVEVVAPRILRMILQQGIKRQIRLMLAAVGYEVRELVRTRIGSLEDSKLKAGKWRRLKPHEIELLKTNPGKTKKNARLPAGISTPPPSTPPRVRRPAAKKSRGFSPGGPISRKPVGPAKSSQGPGQSRGPVKKKAPTKTGRAHPVSGPRKGAAPGSRRPAAKKSGGRGRGR